MRSKRLLTLLLHTAVLVVLRWDAYAANPGFDPCACVLFTDPRTQSTQELETFLEALMQEPPASVLWTDTIIQGLGKIAAPLAERYAKPVDHAMGSLFLLLHNPQVLEAYRTKLRGGTAQPLAVYLAGHLRNKLRAEYRRDQWYQPLEHELLDIGLERPEMVILVRELEGFLPPHQWQLLRLYYLEGLRLQDIAPRVGLSLSQVSRRINALLRQLRVLIEASVAPVPTAAAAARWANHWSRWFPMAAIVQPAANVV